jgi:hypothetical protein
MVRLYRTYSRQNKHIFIHLACAIRIKKPDALIDNVQNVTHTHIASETRNK